MTKKVSIVILSMNQIQFSRLCLANIRRKTEVPYEIVWVDNGSWDGTGEWLAGEKIDTLIRNKANHGFAGGCNQGMNAAKGDYILLLNNDIIVTPGWLEGMLSALESSEKMGIVGPMTNYISGPQKVDEAQGLYTDFSDELDTYAERFRDANRGVVEKSNRLVGFCMLFERSLIDEIGLLDEQFGGCGSFEDDDFCIRAMEAGYELAIAREVFVHHFGHVTLDDPANNLNKQESSRRNSKLFLEKWGQAIVDKYKLTIYAPKAD
ncbi:MAG: glycosyltransferase family 2 protein [Planctomycetes bacterium]|nr:glycosyltransferase family 2 protein [Planctomycetota bacterium]